MLPPPMTDKGSSRQLLHDLIAKECSENALCLQETLFPGQLARIVLAVNTCSAVCSIVENRSTGLTVGVLCRD